MLEQARSEQLARLSSPPPFASSGTWPVLRKLSLDCRLPITAGQRLSIETMITRTGETSLSLRQTVRLADGAVAAEADVILVCVDSAGRPCPLPEALAAFTAHRPSVRASETRHLAVRDLAIALDVQGDGPPVLFVHGFPLDRTMWRPVTALLTGWRRIAPDLRGFGLSDVPATFSMPDYADDLAALLDALHLPQAVVCGLSMGGYVAFELLRRHPEKVRALILANTRAEADDQQAKQRRDEMIGLVQREGPGALAHLLVPQLLAPANLSAMPQVVESLRATITGNPAPGLIGALKAMRDRADYRALLEEIRVPTLVIGGREDRLVPPDSARRLAREVPGAQLTLIPDAGHLTPLEQPVATSRVIAEFLQALE
jgi:pimeloyl-ACP methyl ester carboxylesterase/acyl-CoA thioesterase FadM